MRIRREPSYSEGAATLSQFVEEDARGIAWALEHMTPEDVLKRTTKG